jgi:DNA-directed RNA polymerase specialized sigma24 family protein
MVTPLAVIVAHFAPEQIRVASWYFYDGMNQRDIAELLDVSQQAVAKQLAAIRRKLAALGIPEPQRMEHPTATRSVRPIATASL